MFTILQNILTRYKMKIFVFLVTVGIAVCSERIIQPGREIIEEIFAGSKINAIGESRIVGGQNARIENYPWQISLQVRSGTSYFHICGGSIIDNSWIVTAAHCVDGQVMANLRIAAGTTSLSDNSRTTRSFTRIITHPQYSSSAAGYPNDIALIQLSSPLTFGSTINKIAVPTTKEFVGTQCFLSGWGRLSGSGSSPDILQDVAMPVIANSECRNRWVTISGATILDGHICVFVEGKSACSGDSGGPMTCYHDNIPYLAGATSWGINSCSGSYPSVYVRLTQYRAWISGYVSI